VSRVVAVQVSYCCVHVLSLVGCGGDVAYLGIEARLVSGSDRRAEAYETLLRPGERALDQRVRSIDFAVVDEAAVDRRVCAVADVDEALVQFRPLVVAGLALLGNRRPNAGRVPGRGYRCGGAIPAGRVCPFVSGRPIA